MLIVSALFLAVLQLFGAEKIFDLSFDDYTVKPQIAKGSKEQKGFANPDLQLRMYQGVNGKGNALNLGNSEKLSYQMKGNFNPKEGTIILWVAPQNWELNQKKFQLLFYATQAKYYMYISKIWPNYIAASIRYTTPWYGKKYFSTQVQARLNPADWSKGRYHQIALTWNSEIFNLYIDGQRPAKTPIFVGSRAVPPTTPARKFPQPVNFPEASGTFSLGGNQWVKNNRVDPVKSTAFDQVTIYDKALTSAEILKEYEKVIPPVKKKPENQLTIPKLKGSIKLTGDLSDPVWQKAAKVPVIPVRNAPEGNVHAAAWHNGKDLYVGFSTDLPCAKKKYTKRDQSLWEDDVFEFHILTPDKNHYQYIINGNNAIFDQLNGKMDWNSKAKTAVKHNKKGWTAELVIPLSEFKSNEFKGEFCAASRPGILYNIYRWGSKSIYLGPAGKMVLGKTADTFRLDTVGDPEAGKLNLSGFSSKDAQLKISFAGEQPQIYPIVKGNFKADYHLQSGKQHLELSSQGVIWQQEVNVSRPLNLSFDFQLEKNELTTNVDFSSADDETLKKLNKSGFEVKLALKDPKGKTVVSKTFKTKNVRTAVSMILPADLAEGTYQLEGKAGSIVTSIPLRRPNLAPYKEKHGADNTVPVPWTPVKQLSSKSFQVWGRTYEFNNSPFPQQITHGKDKLLAEPPVWKLDGKNIKWDSFRIVSKAQDKAVFSGRGSAGKITFNWRGELWFDGAYILKLEAVPNGVVPISSFGFDYAVAPEFGRYAMNPEYLKWENNKVTVQLGPGKGRKENMLWLSGPEKGIMVWTESNANWVVARKTAPFTAVRSDKKSAVSVKIISKKVKLGKKANYTFVFIGTPTRPFPPRHRAVNYHGYHVNPLNTHQSIGWGQFKTFKEGDDPQHFNTPYPAYPDRLRRSIAVNFKRNGRRLHFYTMPAVLSNTTADYDYFSQSFKTIPEESYSYVKLGERFYAPRFCLRRTSAPTDYWTWTLNKLLTDFPGMGGLYFDCASTNFCANEQHGCGGIDAFGQPYVTSDALGYREFFMRIYKVHKKYKDTSMMIHSHVQTVPFAHAFSDFFAPGENSCEAVYKNPEYPYTEEVSLEQYQTDYNSRKIGLAYCMILQNARAAGIMPSLNHYRKKFLSDPEYAIRAITPFLIHDVNIWDTYVQRKTIIRYWQMRKDIDIGSVSRFVGYWEKDAAVKSTAPKMYCSVYEWNTKAPYKRAIAVGNFTRNEQKIGLVIDWKKLGVEKPKTVRELWTGKDIPVSELENFKLKGSHFALFGVK